MFNVFPQFGWGEVTKAKPKKSWEEIILPPVLLF